MASCALNFAENAIVSTPITCENIYFDEYGFAHDRKIEKPKTKLDKIRGLSAEELAAYFEQELADSQPVDWLTWLQEAIE